MFEILINNTVNDIIMKKEISFGYFFYICYDTIK